MLTQERLKYLLNYDPETGNWTWRNPANHNSRLKGRSAGNVRNDGYRIIRIDTVPYYAHRLAFLYMTGLMPKEEVDHIDRDPFNNAWSNLREATSSQNKYNRRYTNGVYRGVYPCGSRWQVQVEGLYLGLFDTLDEAISVRDATAKAWSKGFALLNTGTNT